MNSDRPLVRVAPAGRVLARRMAELALEAWVTHSFWPEITHSPFTCRARVVIFDMSLPLFGSLTAKHRTVSPEHIFGSTVFFSSSEPLRMIGAVANSET